MGRQKARKPRKAPTNAGTADTPAGAARRTWTFSTAVTPSRRFAEVVIQPDPRLYERLVDDAQAVGLVRAADVPPKADAAVRILDGCFTGLALDGLSTTLAPDEPLPLSSAWLKAALET
ncbi:hypothetical protein [Streptomyces prunicolor]|uniref:hypothetical protein n=1 Tax=Streptomyces prunicolor TaxID=67348 RepID=UPI000375CC92|nr:hypothetical protein [Streptomyces prunicolor]